MMVMISRDFIKISVFILLKKILRAFAEVIVIMTNHENHDHLCSKMLRNRIITMRPPGVALTDSFDSKPKALDWAVLFKSL
jgi:hypothetical protein